MLWGNGGLSAVGRQAGLTAGLVTGAGGRGIATQVDHTQDEQVRALFATAGREEGRLEVLGNNAWGGYEHHDVDAFVAQAQQPFDLSQTEPPEYLARAVAALAADPAVGAKSGQVVTARELAREYGFTDTDGRQPEPFRMPTG